MAKFPWQDDEPKSDAKERFDAASESFKSLLRYLIDSSLSSRVEIATLKRYLAEKTIQFDTERYEVLYQEEQQRELKAAASYSDRVAQATERAAARMKGDIANQ